MTRIKLLLLAPLLVGCTNHGGGFSPPAGWTYMDTGGASSYTCEEVVDAASYCETGEHPNLCDC